MLHNPLRCYVAFSLFLFLCFAAVLFLLSLSFIPLCLQACLFISYWAVPGSFFCFEFKHNISTLRQKTTTYLTYRQTDIHFDYYSCMLSFFCAPTSWLFMFMFLFFSLAFHRFRSFPFENEKKIFGNKRSTFSKDREGKTTLRLCSRFLCKVTLGIIKRGFVFNTN